VGALADPFTLALVSAIETNAPGFLDILHKKLAEQADLPIWKQDAAYVPGTVVLHQGRRWVALPDVDKFSPDDIYDPETMTGGWAPL
jgi:chitodextrinase